MGLADLNRGRTHRTPMNDATRIQNAKGRGWTDPTRPRISARSDPGIRIPFSESPPKICGSLCKARECKPVQVYASAFVEDIHVSSNSCKDVQARANAGSVSEEKSQDVQTHASLSKDLAGSLLDGLPTDSEVLRSGRPLLTVRQVAKLLGVCSATVYRLCGRGELPHFRVLNAIRIDPRTVKRFLAQSRRRGLPVRPKALYW